MVTSIFISKPFSAYSFQIEQNLNYPNPVGDIQWGQIIKGFGYKEPKFTINGLPSGW